jgi:uroporphyrinogen decarboxylase
MQNPVKPTNRKPDFKNLAEVLERRRPSRPTLFEFYLNPRLYKELARGAGAEVASRNDHFAESTIAYEAAGYDFVTVNASGFNIVDAPFHEGAKTQSWNEVSMINDRESFDAFHWKEPGDYDDGSLARMKDYLPQGMKVIPWGPGGVLENLCMLVGYENLCYMIHEDSTLVEDICERIGNILLKYYSRVLEHDFVGAIISNDDWGFRQQTMLSVKDLRRFIFPWHRRIVELTHAKGRYAILHSCGNHKEIIDDIISDMKYDAKHSYEDNIIPVEIAYEELKGRIAVLGGIDVDYMVRSDICEIRKRSTKLLEQTEKSGGYALGTGNSVPEYIPDSHYYAMIQTAWD